MAAKHTPGPWSFGYYGCNGYCINGGGQHIATSILYKKDGGEANARLIAAAPDLLEALQMLSDVLPSDEFMRAQGKEPGPGLVMMRAALLKATEAAS